MKLDQELVETAVQLLKKRYQDGEPGGAAAMYTKEGKVLTSTYNKETSAKLCHETGAICEAHKYEYTITASVCVLRRTSSKKVVIATPCGICQERLYFWGPEVEVAVPDPKDPTKWVSKTLKEIQPYHWATLLDTE